MGRKWWKKCVKKNGVRLWGYWGVVGRSWGFVGMRKLRLWGERG